MLKDVKVENGTRSFARYKRLTGYDVDGVKIIERSKVFLKLLQLTHHKIWRVIGNTGKFTETDEQTIELLISLPKRSRERRYHGLISASTLQQICAEMQLTALLSLNSSVAEPSDIGCA